MTNQKDKLRPIQSTFSSLSKPKNKTFNTSIFSSKNPTEKANWKTKALNGSPSRWREEKIIRSVLYSSQKQNKQLKEKVWAKIRKIKCIELAKNPEISSAETTSQNGSQRKLKKKESPSKLTPLTLRDPSEKKISNRWPKN